MIMMTVMMMMVMMIRRRLTSTVGLRFSDMQRISVQLSTRQQLNQSN